MSHRTPRYIYDRFKVYLYEKRHPDSPWLTAKAVELLDTLLPGIDVALEWGSGRSTAWLAKRTRHLTSVEHDQAWHEIVKKQCAAKNLSNVEVLFRSLEDDESKNAYVAVCDRFKDGELGLALIDGADLRVECAIAAIPKLAVAGLLVLDNANLYIDWPTRAPNSRAGRGHAGPDWEKFAGLVRDWRLIRTSNGVTDTGIWIRPS
jgi:predicted O-methyltransferase YrrM